MSVHSHLRPLTAALLALSVALGAARAEASADPDSSAGIRILNGLPTRALLYNTLTTNSEANSALTHNPLSTNTFATVNPLKDSPRDPAARAVLQDIVECALQPGQTVQWTHPDSNGPFTFEGQAGLCPEWATGTPSARCLGYVSACLLARNNALGAHVDITMRGEDAGNPWRFNPALMPYVWTPLLQPAPVGNSLYGLTPEVGWRGESIGTCQPGLPVTLGAGAYPTATCSGSLLGSISGDRVLRVCAYPSDCTGAAKLADTEGSYCTIAPLVTFTCPSSGQYSVLSAPYSRSDTKASSVRPATTGNGALSYPASNYGAYSTFDFREGAFFGTLFDPSALAVQVTFDAKWNPVINATGLPKSGPVYRSMYACYGKSWSSESAMSARRLCANTPDGSAYGCAAESTGPCEAGTNDTRTPRCATGDGNKVLGDGDFEQCTDTSGRAWPYAITTFLRSPCDQLSPSDQQVCTQQCGNVCSPSVCTWQCQQVCRPKTDTECLQ